MSNLREAAQQALNSLRGYRREIGCKQPCDAERALEAALEQPHCATQDCMPSKCSLAAQNAEQDRVLVEMEHALNEADAIMEEVDRVLVEMEHALNEADAIMEEVDEETADAWRKRWGRLWGRTV